MPRLLLIDDDKAIIPQQVRLAFAATEYEIKVAPTAAEGLSLFQSWAPDVVILDLRLPDSTGLELFRKLREIDRRTPVVFATMTKGADEAIEAMKLGAFDYLFKPLDLKELQKIVGEALLVSKRMREPAVVAADVEDSPADGAIIGSCPQMREVYKAIGRVSAQDVPVLITGESGTGKELVARAIYQHSARSQGPFLVLNCAAIPEQLLESELFGHEKGAFTGADRRRIGKFEQVNGGTLFLDEIGDMPAGLQAKMLRVLQEQQFERVGGNETIQTNVRVIAATHRDLRAWSQAGKYRPDLYYRLSVFTIHLPALRERGNDLEALVRYYVRRLSAGFNREIHDVSAETLARLQSYNWPGNIRELQSVLKQALLHASGDVLLPSFLPQLGEAGAAPAPAMSDAQQFDLTGFISEHLTADATELHDTVHRQVDRILLTKVLEFTGGNQYQAARVLGLSRQTLRTRLREMKIQVTQTIAHGEDHDE
ncbi:sigma-54-dependent transcriptional regulator [Planctomicrobium piriforme]|uniref:DNA-binding transcriptional regulator NtrC n=1 Tax=Planctomicrobium piriforme TaxID=1576369 RepID=A0A1I3CHH5_9PLAN|nr:sigma-54 dependent transcriptional regulator [Planctomicrobium piriforme]SFH73551.1 two-component system, NtrC family, nitrogen regulation response regulator GlnG [Planctomicrobium piriforme]